MVTACNTEEFERKFSDAEVDIVVAESLLGANLIEILRQLRAQGATCGVVWLHDDHALSGEGEPLNYSDFADRHASKRIDFRELRAILLALFAILKRHGWR